MGVREIIEDWKQKPLRDVLIEMYIDRDMNPRQIATELHVTHKIVYLWLKEFGISSKKDNLF